MFSSSSNFTFVDSITVDDLKQLFDVKIVVELPVEPLKSNATNTNGKVLTWTLNRGEDSDITFSFTLLSFIYNVISAPSRPR